eukprot:4030773-Prymnesium_polylepis.1
MPYTRACYTQSVRFCAHLEVGAAPNSHRLLGKLALDDTGAWRARYFNVTRPRHTSRFQKLLPVERFNQRCKTRDSEWVAHGGMSHLQHALRVLR